MGNIRDDITYFNGMYQIPKITGDEELTLERLNDFRLIFAEEIEEAKDIVNAKNTIDRAVSFLDWVGDLMVYCLSECERWGFEDLSHTFSEICHAQRHNQTRKSKINMPYDNWILNFATGLAKGFNQPFKGSPENMMRDILFDSMIRIFNFSNANHVHLYDVLKIIMKSNFSKLDENGHPIFDERGKVLKGPNFTPPEPELEKYLKINWGIR